MGTTEKLTPDQLSTAAVIANPYPAYRQFCDQTPLNYVDLPASTVPASERPIRAWVFCPATTF